jgi:hypothetical protein
MDGVLVQESNKDGKRSKRDRVLSKKAQEMVDVDEEVEEITHNAGRKGGRKKEGGVGSRPSKPRQPTRIARPSSKCCVRV